MEWSYFLPSHLKVLDGEWGHKFGARNVCIHKVIGVSVL